MRIEFWECVKNPNLNGFASICYQWKLLEEQRTFTVLDETNLVTDLTIDWTICGYSIDFVIV